VRATEKEERKKEKGREEEERRIRFYWVHGAMLGAKIHDAMLPATLAPRRQSHGASDHGVMTLYLGAIVDGAKIRVHFLKSFRKGHI
jgi:hypothetical protein